MLKYSLIAIAAAAVMMPSAQAQVGSMSMDEQIARIHQAELEIQALDAATFTLLQSSEITFLVASS